MTTVDGTLLPPSLADEVHRRLLLLDRFPQLCQVSIDGAVAVERAQCVEARVNDATASGVEPWVVAAVGVCGVVVGLFAGYLTAVQVR